MTAVRLEVLHDLLSEDGRRLLDEAAWAYDDQVAAGGPQSTVRPDALALGTRLRRSHAGEDPDLVAAALSQIALRRRARTKLGRDADRMFLTADALEQATPRQVADHRAARLATAGGRLVDLGCGVGSDLVAAARAGLQVTGVEPDPVRAEMARANLAALGLSGQVVQARAEELDLSGYDLVFADPARRDARGRVFDPAAFSPPWSFVERLLAARAGCVKTAPTLPHRLVPAGVEAEWMSEHGEVKEAALWSGPLATALRRATLLPGSQTLTASGTAPAVGPVGAYLYEPDGAVIRAGLVAELGERLEAHLLDPRIAYLGSDTHVDTPYARGFAVVEILPYKEKQLRAALRARDVGALTVKKRGVAVSPEALRRRLRLRGARAATVVLTRAGGTATALLVEPLG